MSLLTSHDRCLVAAREHGERLIPEKAQIDIGTPSVARMYDYLINGTDNYESDRAACRELLEMAPSTRELALINRAFLVRAVRYLAQECGIRRFIDHGSGLPTRPNVHQVAQEVDSDARVVYIDSDPLVHAHGRLMLAEDLKTTAVIEADMRDVDANFQREGVASLLQDGEPVAALFVSVLHCIPDRDDPWRLVKSVADKLPDGSYMVISQLASNDVDLREQVTEFMRQTTGGNWGRVRSFDEVKRYFDDLQVVESNGPVEVSTWKPDTDLFPRQATNEWIEYGAVARIVRS
ncbi:SAM-dependent methyltransferase [Streptomyces sp. NPDC058247]|uniref:SAM-dependent methyltransferase n=1 Tax=Streptomyces sp. NPDC058247 TaxID=3346401 RepID=UPI0036E68118